jgi:hypothetical protein
VALHSPGIPALPLPENQQKTHSNALHRTGIDQLDNRATIRQQTVSRELGGTEDIPGTNGDHCLGSTTLNKLLNLSWNAKASDKTQEASVTIQDLRDTQESICNAVCSWDQGKQ